jgi:uncharacterized protein
MGFLRRLGATALLALCFAQTLAAQTFPTADDLFVNDYADLLDVQQEEDLRATLQELRDERDIEFTVLTISRMSDYGHDGAIEPFATSLFNTWGIGNADRNDGVLLLVVRFDRELRIEVGSGYGTVLNGPMQRIINKQIVPYFKLDAYPEGIKAGVDEVIFQITDRYPGEYDASALTRTVNRGIRIITGVVAFFGAWLGLLIVPAIPIGRRLYQRWQRNHARKCPTDGSRMRRYIEETEDEMLTPGQQMEERLKSIDHDVWFCGQCDHITIESYPTKQKTFGACSNCNHRTLEGRSLITAMPSATAPGRREITWTCHHCNHESVETKVIPVHKPRDTSHASSSSSRSSRSRRGRSSGGRSSGGGASGRW